VTCRPVAGQRLCKHVPAETFWVNSPLLGKTYNIARQQSDNFRFYVKRCKYNNIGSSVFYVVHIYPLLGNRCVFYGSDSSPVVNQTSVLVSSNGRIIYNLKSIWKESVVVYWWYYLGNCLNVLRKTTKALIHDSRPSWDLNRRSLNASLQRYRYESLLGASFS
jgi:hypothetical protein